MIEWMDFFADLTGRFHPLVVHLPIGFLLLGVLLLFFDRKRKQHQQAIRFSFLWGGIAAFFAVLTGYVQYRREGYLWEDIQGHFIFGITTLVFAFAFYVHLSPGRWLSGRNNRSALLTALLVALFATGHLGGNLTHGKDHLTASMPDDFKGFLGMETRSGALELNPESYQKESLYLGVIQPVLDKKCVSCHNPNKSKGDLRLDNYAALMAGGSDGSILSKDDFQESPLLQRIHLPLTEKKHMPPKAKTQLTRAEIQVIEKWVALGAPEKESIADLGLKKALFSPFFPKDPNGMFPDLTLDYPDKFALKKLQEKGLLVAPIFESSVLLQASCINVPYFDNGAARELLSLKDHIVSLNLSGTQVTDSVFHIIGQLSNLTILKMNNTRITGQGVMHLKPLQHLKQIHFTHTDFHPDRLELMFAFPALEKVYLYPISQQQPKNFAIPDTLNGIFQTGEYELEALGDSIHVRDVAFYKAKGIKINRKSVE